MSSALRTMVADPIGAYLQSSLSKHNGDGGQAAILQSKLQVSEVENMDTFNVHCLN